MSIKNTVHATLNVPKNTNKLMLPISNELHMNIGLRRFFTRQRDVLVDFLQN